MFLALCLATALSGVASAAEVPVTTQGHAYNPVWSLDGQWLAFELNRFEGGGVDLMVVKMANGNAVGAPAKVTVPGGSSQFSAGGSTVISPVWLPQGQLIFQGAANGGTSRLFYWKPGGSSPGQLLTLQQISGDLSWPTVTLDGRKLAFVSDATGQGDIYVWNQAENTVKLAVGSPQSEGAPRWALDGMTLAYSRQNQGGEDMFTWAGENPVPRVGGNGDQSRPSWAGMSLVFFTNERGDDKWDIAVSEAAGQKRTLAKDVRLPLRAPPALSVDRQWVAYGFSDPKLAGKIRLTKVDGSKSVDVDTGLNAAAEPSLAMANGRVYLAFTALPLKGSDWRQLHVVDVTDKLQ